MRRVLFALALLSVASPAQAAPRPLAYSGAIEQFALAGETAFAATPEGGVFSVPTAGGSVARALPNRRDTTIHDISASPQRAAVIRITTGRASRAQLFAGPPFTALTAPILAETAEPFPFRVQVDGDRLFSFSGIAPDTVAVRGPDGREIAFPPGASPLLAEFNGDLVAYPMTWTERDPRFVNRRLVVADWRTGTTRYTVDLPGVITELALNADGRVLATVEEASLYEVSTTGAQRWLAFTSGHARFAGEHIVYQRSNALHVIDPSGRTRRFGVRTRSLTTFTTDATHVLWVANGCLLVAPVTDPAVDSIGRGPCPRGELEFAGEYPPPPLRRNVPLQLRCITAPRACTGELRLRIEGRAVGPWLRISVPAGRTRRVALRLTAAGLQALKRADRRAGPVDVGIELRFNGTLRVPVYSLTVGST